MQQEKEQINISKNINRENVKHESVVSAQWPRRPVSGGGISAET